MTMQFGWTPDQVNRLDPHFIDELIVRMNAQKSHDQELVRKAEKKAKRDQARAKSAQSRISRPRRRRR